MWSYCYLLLLDWTSWWLCWPHAIMMFSQCCLVYVSVCYDSKCAACLPWGSSVLCMSPQSQPVLFTWHSGGLCFGTLLLPFRRLSPRRCHRLALTILPVQPSKPLRLHLIEQSTPGIRQCTSINHATSSKSPGQGSRTTQIHFKVCKISGQFSIYPLPTTHTLWHRETEATVRIFFSKKNKKKTTRYT
jgi:hypothetical protein